MAATPCPRMHGGMGPPPPIPPYPHDTEFSVITVGTGNPQPNLERASACTMLQYKGKYYVVDMGNGAQNSMLRGAKGTFPFRDIAALCFTHFHQDHTNDYFDIMTNRWLTGGKEVTVVGPPGVGRAARVPHHLLQGRSLLPLAARNAARHERHGHVRRGDHQGDHGSPAVRAG